MAVNLQPVGNNNFYLNVINTIHNALFQLHLPRYPLANYPNDERMSKLSQASDTRVKNIELAPVVIDRVLNPQGVNPVISPSIYLSVDSSQSANDLVGELQAFIELLNVRVELYLGEINNNFNMTQLAAELINDVGIVLDPTEFIGAQISSENMNMRTGNAKIMNAGISQWAFDERTRGTGHEILVFIFSVELHHYVTGATIMTTD